MLVRTTRFGTLEVEAEDVLAFANGLVGFEDCRRWVLLADAENPAIGWLQCVTRPAVALAVVSPRRFVPDYQFRVYRSELAELELTGVADAQVVVVVGRNDRAITLDLKAPIVIHLALRRGCQVVTHSDLPTQFEVAPLATPLKMTA